jgi:hypothetical protein
MPACVVVRGRRGDGRRGNGGGALLADELVDVPVEGHGARGDCCRDGGERDRYEHQRQPEAQPPDPGFRESSHVDAGLDRQVLCKIEGVSRIPRFVSATTAMIRDV